MQVNDIVKFSYTVDGINDMMGFIAFDFKMSNDRAKKVILQQARVLSIVNQGSHAIVGYLDGSQELLPIDTLEKVG